MVQAILNDRKSMTRRIIKPQPSPEPNRIEYYSIPGWGWMPTSKSGKIGIFNPVSYKCPYGKVGDRLWVRETWAIIGTFPLIIRYKANGDDYFFSKHPKSIQQFKHGSSWRPSIFMPRWVSRITLEITDIRVERVQDIKPEDCEEEGIWGETKASPVRGLPYEIYHCQGFTYTQPIEAFQELWDSINEKRGYGWDINPWVWVINFKKELKQ